MSLKYRCLTIIFCDLFRFASFFFYSFFKLFQSFISCFYVSFYFKIKLHYLIKPSLNCSLLCTYVLCILLVLCIYPSDFLIDTSEFITINYKTSLKNSLLNTKSRNKRKNFFLNPIIFYSNILTYNERKF